MPAVRPRSSSRHRLPLPPAAAASSVRVTVDLPAAVVAKITRELRGACSQEVALPPRLPPRASRLGRQRHRPDAAPSVRAGNGSASCGGASWPVAKSSQA
jgi:hypothetical protein